MPALDYILANLPADQWIHNLEVWWWPTWRHNYSQKPTFTGWQGGRYYFWKGANYCCYWRSWGAGSASVGSTIDFMWLNYPTVFDSDTAIGHSWCSYSNPVVPWRVGFFDRAGIPREAVSAAWGELANDCSGSKATLNLDAPSADLLYTASPTPGALTGNLYGVNYDDNTAADELGQAHPLLSYSPLASAAIGMNVTDLVRAIADGRAYEGMAFIAGSEALHISPSQQGDLGPELMYALWEMTYKRNISHDESTQITHGTIEATQIEWSAVGLGNGYFQLDDGYIALEGRARVTERPVTAGWS